MKLNSKAYDALKQVALIWLPALASLYFALSKFWTLPDVNSIVGSITALDTVLGGILHISSISYTPPAPKPDGIAVVDPVKRTVSLDLGTHPEDIITLKEGQTITFKVAQAVKS